MYSQKKVYGTYFSGLILYLIVNCSFPLVQSNTLNTDTLGYAIQVSETSNGQWLIGTRLMLYEPKYLGCKKVQV